ncbi:hypothetical protein [Streptomyces sp. NPDC058955]|uniref:hypothetical protein n=1 Tax=unclassified Streptomyces TaxID=2593676 RepID=UPI00365CAF55
MTPDRLAEREDDLAEADEIRGAVAFTEEDSSELSVRQVVGDGEASHGTSPSPGYSRTCTSKGDSWVAMV